MKGLVLAQSAEHLERLYILRKQAREEAHEHFRQNITPFEKDYDNSVDAFRHAHTSAIFTYYFSDEYAEKLGGLNEIWGDIRGLATGRPQKSGRKGDG